MIKKISGLKVGRTEEQEMARWAEIFSHRNKLLLNSDWTQLDDCGLTDECKDQWRGWRQQLKNVNRSNFSDMELAEKHISILAKRMPFNTYKPVDMEPVLTEPVSLDTYRTSLVAYLDRVFNDKMATPFLDNDILVDEQFKEVLDYDNNPKSKYPLIDLTSESYNISRDDVIKDFIDRKTNQLVRIAKLKKKYVYFRGLVDKASTDVELQKVQAEVKQWILT